jgi:hypothetical protein
MVVAASLVVYIALGLIRPDDLSILHTTNEISFTVYPDSDGLWLLAAFGLSTTRALRLVEDQIHFFVHFAFLTELIFAK